MTGFLMPGDLPNAKHRCRDDDFNELVEYLSKSVTVHHVVHDAAGKHGTSPRNRVFFKAMEYTGMSMKLSQYKHRGIEAEIGRTRKILFSKEEALDFVEKALQHMASFGGGATEQAEIGRKHFYRETHWRSGGWFTYTATGHDTHRLMVTVKFQRGMTVSDAIDLFNHLKSSEDSHK